MIKRFICYCVNSLCCLIYRNDYQEFKRIIEPKVAEASRSNILKVQENKLFQILRANQSCEYGRRYDFESISSIKEFQEKVPVSVYEDYLEDIWKIRKGESNILTSEEILLLEPSSGSTSASKLIPYTKTLKAEFQKGIRPWLYDLYQNVQGLKWGQSYWSITPAATVKRKSEDRIPVGFDDDKEYFGSLENKLFDLVFAVPSSVARLNTMEEFYHQTALGLLNCQYLTLISVWNPSLLLLIIEYIENNSIRLTEEITHNNRRRGEEIQKILTQKSYSKLWKNLKVISCWSDANAQVYADRLKKIFPDVLIQPKGLLATEGFISFPLSHKSEAVLSVQSHFFEFISLDNQKIYLAHELQINQEYAVILTTSGGLYRYQLKDIVRVTGFAGSVPLIKFVGKQDKVSDLFGEKMNEQFVRGVLEKLELKTGYSMLAPETDRYVLYLQTEETGKGFDNKAYHNLEDRIDQEFRANFHYDYCRRLGQLKAVRVFHLTGQPEREYLDECMKRGQRLGDIKPVLLHMQGGWHHVFKGEYA